MSEWKAGDRVELVSMPDDPNPVPVGTKGTVTGVSEWRHPPSTQVNIDWDNGRTLSAVVPPDVIRRTT